MPYPLPDIDGLINEVDESFVRVLRRNLTATQFFGERRVADLGIRRFDWREISDLDGVRISMEIPDLQQSGGGIVTEQSIEIPVMTRDMHFDGRDWLAYRRYGEFDTVVAEQNARIMAYMLNDYLYLGGAAATEADVPGPDTGLLNDANRQTLDNSATTDWNNPEDVVDDLAEAVRLLMDAPGDNEGGFEPPFTLLMSPADADLFERLRANTDSRTSDLLPSTVQGPIYDRVVDANEAFLIKVSPENFDAVTPFGLGNVQRIVDAPSDNELMMGRGMWMRMISAAAPRVIRPESVVDITFDRA